MNPDWNELWGWICLLRCRQACDWGLPVQPPPPWPPLRHCLCHPHGSSKLHSAALHLLFLKNQTSISRHLPHANATSAHSQCFVESVRGKKDWVNGSLAGAVSGLALGLRSECYCGPALPLSSTAVEFLADWKCALLNGRC